MSVNDEIKTGSEMTLVADRRRWQSAMTSPIGDVGSERVKPKISNCTILYFFYSKLYIPTLYNLTFANIYLFNCLQMSFYGIILFVIANNLNSFE